MPKKKLLFVITKSAWGGAGRYVYDLATALKDDYDVAVALGGTGPLTSKLSAAGIRTIPIPFLGRDMSTSKDSAAFFQILKIVRAEKPDIVHLNSSKAGGLGALAARLVGVKNIIFTAHGWAHNEPVAPLTYAFRWGAALATLLLCHKVITVSHFDDIHTPLGLKTIPIHNGIVPPDFLPRAEAQATLQKIQAFPTDRVLIGTIGELNKNLGYYLTLEALLALTPEERKKFAYIAISGGEQEAELRAYVQDHGLSDSVYFMGFIQDASKLLSAFDMFLYTPVKVGLSYALLEAGAAGLPVIATVAGGNPEVIDDQTSGVLVPPYDTEALAKAITELVDSPNTRERFGMRHKEKVLRYFGLRGMVKKTVEVYEL